MGLFGYVYSEKSCSCCNFNTFSKFSSSYFLHVALALLLLLFSADFTLALDQNVAQPHPKLTISSRNDSKLVGISREKNLESQRTLPSPTELLADIKKDDGSSDQLSPESKGLFFGEDSNGVPIVVGTWFRYGSYTLAFCMFGTAFLVACVASAIYYVLFVVTEPSQQVRSMDENEQGQWNVGRILRALQLAYETYETFDPYNPSCQLKTVCEIQEGGQFQGSMLKRLTHFIIHSELVQKKMANAEELQAADRIGNDPGETCATRFPKCRFSLNQMYEKYVTM